MTLLTSSPSKLARTLEILRELKRRAPLWRPLAGPQTMAYYSDADVIGFGGAAGGGKTDLALGKALTQHRRAFVFRKNGTEHTAFIDRMFEVVGTRDGWNGKDSILRFVDPTLTMRQIELGSAPNLGDEQKHRGRPHDLKVFDEAAEMLEYQVRFLLTWMRTTIEGQRCQALLTFNPPSTAEGRWIIDYFGPWLDKKHAHPAQPGELRWFASISGKDVEVPDSREFILRNGQRVYEFDRAEYSGARAVEIIRPQSRTFIPARVTDNPYLMGTSYMTTLQALPEPLRSQLLYGDFQAGITDDPWQVIPTAWVEAAQARWKPLDRKPPMDSLGADVARGGKDNTLIARRHDNWFDEPLRYPGQETPDGPTVAGHVMSALRNRAPIHIDVVGVGASPYDFLTTNGLQVIGVNVGEKARGLDLHGVLSFANLRSELVWRMREALDPANNRGIALPPDRNLLLDLTAYTWHAQGRVVYVESREEIIKRIGRSPDYGSAYILALMDTPRIEDFARLGSGHQQKSRGHDPYANLKPR